MIIDSAGLIVKWKRVTSRLVCVKINNVDLILGSTISISFSDHAIAHMLCYVKLV